MIALRGALRRDEKEETWKWSGMWTFGTLPDDDAIPQLRKAKNPSVRPFVYTWKEHREASKVLIPSANLKEFRFDHDDDQNDDDDMDKNMEEGDKSRNNAGISPSKKQNDSLITNDESKSVVGDDAKRTPIIKSEGEDMKVEMDGLGSNETNQSHQVDDDRDRVVEGEGSEHEKLKDERAPKEDESNQLLDSSMKSSTTEPDFKKDAITFATTFPGEPPFTDASSVHPKQCPPGGAWSGFFENVSKRKDRSSTRVTEHFCLFFNSTPPKDARVLFPGDDLSDSNADDKKEDASNAGSGLLPPGRIHVRGMGTNQFGTFELTGGLDIETGILECQRMYVITNDSSPSSRNARRASSTSLTAGVTTRGLRRTDPTSTDSIGKVAPRPYQTRKRQMSWRKRASLSEDDDDESGRRSGSFKSKKARFSAEKASVPSAPALMSPPSGNMPITVSIPVVGSNTKRPSPSPRSASVASTPTSTASRKRPASSSSRSGSLANNPSTLKLPPVGDPREARWKAAHFLYYQRNHPSVEESSGSGGSGSNNGSPTASASFVVYEGEMLQGNCLRDGRGVCLYNNNTLYEGEWKRNKEHGRGILMSADRKRVIYNGEWERGRMHGQGIYTYTNEESPMLSPRKDAKSNVIEGGSRYEGDFKENSRHGVGKYYLPDGSEYEGEWRENLMCGRGTFRWPDGSMYVGSWKDGKRNGIGTLQASDGFSYDGMWVNNAMEGRGVATYPSGQRYEGLWAGGRREGRGTIHFTNGAVYEGRFRDDAMEGQGTMKMTKNVSVPRPLDEQVEGDTTEDWMIPISFQSDMGHIHQKAGFTVGGD